MEEEEGVSRMSMCVCLFSLGSLSVSVYDCGQFTIVGENLWNVRCFQQHSRGKYCRWGNLTVTVSHRNAAFHCMCGYMKTKLSLIGPVCVTVCAGGRSAGCGHAVPGRAPGPEAPSADKWAGQRGPFTTPLSAAPQESSSAPHGR